VGWAQQAAAGGAAGPAGAKNGKRILFFTKSQGFPHSVVTRRVGADGKPLEELAFAENLLKGWGEAAGYAVDVSKEGQLLTPAKIATYDAFIFFTTGVLTEKPGTQYKSDQTSAMTAEGKAALLKAIEEGKGFIGLHSATDTFENPAHKTLPVRVRAAGEEGMKDIDPYCLMIGAEFTSHGSQQKSMVRVAGGKAVFPGLEDLKEFEMNEEWYAFTNLAPDLHVILVQDTATMKTDASGKRERQYQGPPYPETWARMHGKGRVFYTGMGHREDVWTNPLYKKILLAALAWGTGLVNGEVKGNLTEACPELVKG
jgi:type 1 glutamine amidotransferase